MIKNNLLLGCVTAIRVFSFTFQLDSILLPCISFIFRPLYQMKMTSCFSSKAKHFRSTNTKMTLGRKMFFKSSRFISLSRTNDVVRNPDSISGYASVRPLYVLLPKPNLRLFLQCGPSTFLAKLYFNQNFSSTFNCRPIKILKKGRSKEVEVHERKQSGRS